MSDTTPRIEQLRQEVRLIVGAEPSILGSKLGFQLQKAIPGLDIKAEFGNLHKFVDHYCAEFLQASFAPGGHVVYLNKELTGEKGLSMPVKASYWQAFTNPSGTLNLYLDRERSALITSKHELPGMTLIKQLSNTDHQALADAFFNTLDPQDQARLQKAKDSNFDWSVWRSALSSERHLLLPWSRYRKDHIVGLFKERIESIGVDSTAVQSLVDQLLESRQDTKVRNKVGNATAATSPERRHSKAFRIRFIEAIDSMSDSELAQVWLPAGVLLRLHQ